MFVTLNGDDREVPEGATITTLVRVLGADPDGRGIAVALDGQVVPRGAWAQTELTPWARVEVLIAVQGG